VEQVDLDVVGKEEPPCEAIKQMATGDVKLLKKKILHSKLQHHSKGQLLFQVLWTCRTRRLRA